ncbi:TIGR02594 family protein [Rhodopseudomonas faecalis]|nr:TIGR02594 family protein [Rhodopseudomonas faecalis]
MRISNMVEFSKSCWLVRFSTLALFSAVLTAMAAPASARPQHGAARHVHTHHAHQRHHHFNRHHGMRHVARRAAPASMSAYGDSYNSMSAESAAQSYDGGFGSTGLVAEARRHLGGNPTGRSRLWCARFMNMVLERAGLRGTGSDMARSFASYGQRISGPQVGAIAVMSRGKRGGHVGVVSGIDANGNPIVVSGNHNRRVAESVYPRSRVYAYVLPSS